MAEQPGNATAANSNGRQRCARCGGPARVYKTERVFDRKHPGFCAAEVTRVRYYRCEDPDCGATFSTVVTETRRK